MPCDKQGIYLLDVIHLIRKGALAPVEKEKEINIKRNAGEVHQNIIDVPMLGEVFAYTENRNDKAEP
jgi:hypothetical protein